MNFYSLLPWRTHYTVHLRQDSSFRHVIFQIYVDVTSTISDNDIIHRERRERNKTQNVHEAEIILLRTRLFADIFTQARERRDE